MAAGLPPSGGAVPTIHDLSSFPPLPSKTPHNLNTNIPTYADYARSKPFVHAKSLPKLPLIPINPPTVTTKDGLKAILFHEEEIEISKEAFKYAMVAQFYGERPSVDQFDHHVNSHWGLEGLAVVGLLNPRNIMVRMSNETDFRKALVKEDCVFNRTRYSLYKWTEDLKETKKAIWIELRKLPVHFQLHSFLEQIGNTIGKFLDVDERTRTGKHPIAPRMCVDFDITNPLPQSIWLGYKAKDGRHIGFQQEITYDFSRARCSHCMQFGHEAFLCPTQEATPKLSFKLSSWSNNSNRVTPKPSKKVWIPKATRTDTYSNKQFFRGQVANVVHSSQPVPTSPSFIPITSEGENLSFINSTPQVHVFEAPTHNGVKIAYGEQPMEPSDSHAHVVLDQHNIIASNLCPHITSTCVPLSNSFKILDADLENSDHNLNGSPHQEPMKTLANSVPPSTLEHLEIILGPGPKPFDIEPCPFPPLSKFDPPNINTKGDHHSTRFSSNINNNFPTFVVSPPVLSSSHMDYLPGPTKETPFNIRDHLLNPNATPYVGPGFSLQLAHIAPNPCEPSLVASHLNAEDNSLHIIPLQAIPSDYNPATYSTSYCIADTSWHNERRNYAKDKITLSSLFKEKEDQIVVSTTTPTMKNKTKSKRVSWINGDIKSTHVFEHDIGTSIEESLSKPQGKPTIKIFKYSKAYRMEGAKHVAWASKYFRDRVNFIDEMDQRQLEYLENHYV